MPLTDTSYRSPDPQDSPAYHDRLDGWKAIGAYLGRGMRTAQRWERELQLPIHRLERKSGEVVYAFRTEIDAWWKAHDHGARLSILSNARADDTSQRGSTPGSGWRGLLRTVRLRRVAVISLASTGVVLLLMMWPISSGPTAVLRRTTVSTKALSGPPVAFTVRGSDLHVQDGFGRTMWTHSFGASIERGDAEAPSGMSDGLGMFATLDRKGTSLLFLGPHDKAGVRRVYRFAADGQIVFVANPPDGATFGGRRVVTDLSAGNVTTTVDALGKPTIWVSYRDAAGSAGVVQKLDASGRPQTEFWTSAPVTLLKDALIGGHHVLLVGAGDQGSATLAVLDYERSSGSAPSDDPLSRCSSCPSGRSLETIRFPRLDLAQALGATPRIDAVTVASDGGLTVSVLQASRDIEGVRRHGTVVYLLTPDFKPAGVEFSEDYRLVHSHLRLFGDLDHRFGPTDLQKALSISSWQGQQFKALTVPTSDSERP